MNNEEKILFALEALSGRIDAFEAGVNKRFEGVDNQFLGINKRLDNIEDDISIIKEEATVTRGTTDQLLEIWVERFGDNDFAQVVALSDVAS